MRVVSLLPSATDLLLRVVPDACGSMLVGRSHECPPPPPWLSSEQREAFDAVPVLTGQKTPFTTAADVDRAVREQLSTGKSLYTLDTELLAELEPDVILTQDLCEVCSVDLETVRGVVAQMPADKRPEVVSLNPQTLEDVFDDLLRVGEAVRQIDRARQALVQLRERFHGAADFVNPFADGPSVAFLEWTDPLFCGGHWTPQLIERAGGRHPLNPTTPVEGFGAGAGKQGAHTSAGKSVVVTAEQLVASEPDVVIVCPCGLSLEQAEAEARQLSQEPWWKGLPAVRGGNVWCVDGNEMFNRPGPRLVEAFEFLVAVLNPPMDVPGGFPCRNVRFD